MSTQQAPCLPHSLPTPSAPPSSPLLPSFPRNVAVGGTWPGDPDAATPFPATMDVDYVRVWGTSEGSSSSGDGGAQGGDVGPSSGGAEAAPAEGDGEGPAVDTPPGDGGAVGPEGTPPEGTQPEDVTIQPGGGGGGGAIGPGDSQQGGGGSVGPGDSQQGGGGSVGPGDSQQSSGGAVGPDSASADAGAAVGPGDSGLGDGGTDAAAAGTDTGGDNGGGFIWDIVNGGT